MTIATSHQPYLLIYKLATPATPLKNTVTALLKYLDLTALLEYIDLLNRYSWGLLGPLSGWGPEQNAPVVTPPMGGPGCTVVV